MNIRILETYSVLFDQCERRYFDEIEYFFQIEIRIRTDIRNTLGK